MMKVVIISGRSGSGKSTALQALEDIGFYCIDNLPALLIPALIEQMRVQTDHPERLAISVDARNLLSNLQQFPALLMELKRSADVRYEVLYLDSEDTTLLKRYSSTRRKHPLSASRPSLEQAIEYERTLLEPIANLADIRIDTTQLSLYDLRDQVKERVAQRKSQTLSLQFESFGFKHGVPLDADLVFDVRVLPNPYWVAELRQFSGLDEPVQTFLAKEPDVIAMIEQITQFLEFWLPKFAASNRSYITVAIGCTGGQHRSVYLTSQLASHFSEKMDNVHIRHRELK